ncbi:hypothetical protein [Dolosigranulum pigrum]|uniref:hypothetical protein n=1 Tax=Dolosigranulum pigrum TaxID=29394 RepID=UPI001AD88CDA|nr:hypothetical protein [Dolosigranulum pigrum]QTJ45394.1 hypothetical protein FE328_07550 [Dolosigranulum pigrum]
MSVLASSMLLTVITPPISAIVAKQQINHETAEHTIEHNLLTLADNLEEVGDIQEARFYRSFASNVDFSQRTNEEIVDLLLDEIQAQNQNRSISVSTISSIVSIIAGGITIVKGAHDLGVYVAKQVEARGIMSKEEYQSGPSIFTYANRI